MDRYENFRRYLHKRVASIEAAYCRGHLYHLPTGFPGLIVPPDKPCYDLVLGELMTFKLPLETLPVLDRLERYDPIWPRRSVYVRRLLPILVLQNAQTGAVEERRAWVYTYPEDHLSPSHAHQFRIECGQWHALKKPPKGRQVPPEPGIRRCSHPAHGYLEISAAMSHEAVLQKHLQRRQCAYFCHHRQQCAMPEAQGQRLPPPGTPDPGLSL